MAKINSVIKNINAVFVNTNLHLMLFQVVQKVQNHFHRNKGNILPVLFVAKQHFFITITMISLYQNYVEQLMTEQEYVTLKASYKAEAEEAERLIAALEQEQRESKVYTTENRFLTEFRSFMGTDTLTKEMASALVERIYVDADRNIDIRLRYRDEYMALLKFIEGRAAV